LGRSSSKWCKSGRRCRACCALPNLHVFRLFPNLYLRRLSGRCTPTGGRAEVRLIARRGPSIEGTGGRDKERFRNKWCKSGRRCWVRCALSLQTPSVGIPMASSTVGRHARAIINCRSASPCRPGCPQGTRSGDLRLLLRASEDTREVAAAKGCRPTAAIALQPKHIVAALLDDLRGDLGAAARPIASHRIDGHETVLELAVPTAW
jgi:hypothetical protein